MRKSNLLEKVYGEEIIKILTTQMLRDMIWHTSLRLYYEYNDS